MTTTADWLHLRLGMPLPDYAETDIGADSKSEITEGEVIARQRARAAQPLSVAFPGR
jgi:hypothetical protein